MKLPPGMEVVHDFGKLKPKGMMGCRVGVSDGNVVFKFDGIGVVQLRPDDAMVFAEAVKARAVALLTSRSP